jgi:hypothetical protein
VVNVAENPNNIPQEQLDQWQALTKSANDNLLGLCLFCQHPILKSEIKIGPTNFKFVPMNLIVKFDDKAMQETLKGFFCCGKCIVEPAKLQVLTQINRIEIDLRELNQKFADELRKYEIKKRYEEGLEKELEKKKTKEKEGTNQEKEEIRQREDTKSVAKTQRKPKKNERESRV